MADIVRHYIDGAWTDPAAETQPIVDPATGDTTGRLGLGTAADTDGAVVAAHRAFPSWAQTTVEERAAALARIADVHEARADDMAAAITADMGMPIDFARLTVGAGIGQFRYYSELIRTYPFTEDRGATPIVKEPIGVCGLIPRGTTRASNRPRKSHPPSPPAAPRSSSPGPHTQVGSSLRSFTTPAFLLACSPGRRVGQVDAAVVHHGRAGPVAKGGGGGRGLRVGHPGVQRGADADLSRAGDWAVVDVPRLVDGFLRMDPDAGRGGKVRDREALPEVRPTLGGRLAEPGLRSANEVYAPTGT